MVCVSTSDMRLIKFLEQHKSSGDHVHEPATGGNAAHTAYYTPEMASRVLEALYPNRFYSSIPSLQQGSACVTLNLSRSQWLNDARGIEAVQKEVQVSDPMKRGMMNLWIPFKRGKHGHAMQMPRYTLQTSWLYAG